MTTTLKWRTVLWKCRQCGTEGRYVRWFLDAEEDNIHVMQEVKMLDECPQCTDGLEGTPETEKQTDLEAAMLQVLDMIKDIYERLERLEKNQ